MRQLVSLIMTGLFIMAAGPAATADSANADSDKAYRQKIIGYWAEGDSPYKIAAFLKDGIYQGWAYKTPQDKEPIVEVKGKWWIENGKLFNELEEMTPPNPEIKPGYTAVDQIVEIEDQKMVLIDEKGNKYTKTKTDKKK